MVSRQPRDIRVLVKVEPESAGKFRMQNFGNNSPATEPEQQLRRCVRRISCGDWAFIQLRGVDLADMNFNAEDVDLLGTETSVYRLLDAAFSWVQQGECHLRFTRRRHRKATLTLFSVDGLHRIQLDLWIELPQISRGRYAMKFSDVPAACRIAPGKQGPPEMSISRLPVWIEVCAYLQHLVCRQKNLASPQVRQRLKEYVELGGSADAETGTVAVLSPETLSRHVLFGLTEAEWRQKLSHALQRCLETEQISPADERLSEQYLRYHLKLNRAHRGSWPRLHGWWLDGTRSPRRMLAIIGCDGTGKTTLANGVQQSAPHRIRHTVGKHLYRKSLIYKLLVIFIRPLICSSRERFDEITAPLNFLLACLHLRILWVLFPHRWRIFDRCTADFLYLNRKTDHPQFSKWTWLRKLIGLRITTVHLVVSPTMLDQRRREVTPQGHSAYDQDMRWQLTRHFPTDYLAVNHDGTTEQMVQYLLRML